MKRTFTLLAIGSIFMISCRKEKELSPLQLIVAESCLPQTESPIGRSYDADSMVLTPYQANHCGMLALGKKNYWVYLDSLFADGVFIKTELDTLQFTNTWTSPDGLIWWEANKSVGIPEMLYANDSALFQVTDRLFTDGIKDVKKDYSLFTGDSIRYLASFEDAAAIGRSLKRTDDLVTPAGKFSNWIYFEKNARNYRKDQVYFKQGVGVIKYIQEKAPMGTPQIKLQQVSTLIAYHLQ